METRNLIIFAGAGASRGVSEKYPTAVDFRAKLPEPVLTNALYKHLDTYFAKQNLAVVDIEHVLWELGRLVETLRESTQGSLLNFLLSRNLVHSLLGGGSGIDGGSVRSYFDRLGTMATGLQDSINAQIYDLYSQVPSDDDLKRSWLPLLNWLQEQFDRIDIVTTNYDLVLEQALESQPALKVATGEAQGRGRLRQLDLSLWEPGAELDGGLLTKLHGSVDWQIGNGGTDDQPVIRPGIPEFAGDHKKRPILYPGFKGRPERQPFIAFHDYFRRRVGEATHIVFIGFAFRDDHINDIIGTARPSSVKIAVVDPAKLPGKLAFLKGAQHLQERFGEQSDDGTGWETKLQDWAK